MKLVNLDQLNQVIVQPLRQALIGNEHVNALTNDDENNWARSSAITALNSLINPNLCDDEVLRAFDNHLYTIMGSGQTRCNSNFLALTYGYNYLLQRVNAIEEAFKALDYDASRTRENGLFVDIGCGVGGLLIALRNLHENADFVLNYRGHDIVEEVLPINLNFLNKIYPNANVVLNGNQIESLNDMAHENIDHVIMVFSYLFSQYEIEESFDDFEKKIDELFEEFNLSNFYLVYINIRPGRYTKYQYFLNQLVNDGKYTMEVMTDTSVSARKIRLNLLSSNRDHLSDLGDSTVHCCVRELKRV